MKPGKPLSRRTPLRPGTTPMARGKGPGTPKAALKRSKGLPKGKKRLGANVARRKANHARAYGSKRAWVVSLPCLVCGYRPCQAAHVGNGGLSRKADAAWLVPLCGPMILGTERPVLVEGHHAESHRTGVKSFATKYGLDLKAEAVRTEAEWQRYGAQ